MIRDGLYLLTFGLVLGGGIALAAEHISAPTRFVSTVQLAVHETNPILMQRSQHLVVEQFAHTFDSWPELQGKRYEVRTAGNEVVFYLVTHNDTRVPMQHAVSAMIQNLNGRVRARGRSVFYRTSLSQPAGGYLEVVLDDTHTKIRSISAQSIPLRDLLREMRTQIGNLSYLIPGECADRMVDWSFGEDTPTEPKSVDAVMTELATLFTLKLEKRNGSYIFTGECNETTRHRPLAAPVQAGDLFRGTVTPANVEANAQPARATEVYFPLLPLGE